MQLLTMKNQEKNGQSKGMKKYKQYQEELSYKVGHSGKKETKEQIVTRIAQKEWTGAKLDRLKLILNKKAKKSRKNRSKSGYANIKNKI